MKRLASITTFLAIAAAFSGCIGDHSVHQGRADTIKNTYQVQADSSKLDTGITKSPDYSSSGGANLIKKTDATKRDSAKQAM
jgi:hypothetical protein